MDSQPSRVLGHAIIGVILAVAVLLAGAASAHASFPGGNGEIAFDSGSEYGIHAVQPDGSGLRTIGETCYQHYCTPERGAQPAWSPDGEFIAFVAGGQLCVMQADASNRRCSNQLGGAVSEPAWSPDGGRIVAAAGGDLYTVRADGTAPLRLTNTADRAETDPAWSPDGARIVYSVRRPVTGSMDLAVIHPDGTGLAYLTRTAENETAPSWSPDGTQLAFGAPPSTAEAVEVYVAPATDLSARTRLTTSSGDDTRPAWSPDGKLIAFESGRVGDWTLWTMSAEGANQTRLGSGGRNADWQPLIDNVLTVNTTNDVDDGFCTSSHCSLREAIHAANAMKGYNRIEFAILPSGPQTIRPASELPALTGQALVDGTTQPGFAGVPLIEIEGTLAGAGADGLILSGGLTTVRALAVNGFAGYGIRVEGPGADTIDASYLGVERDGMTPQGNAGAGVGIVASPNNLVGKHRSSVGWSDPSNVISTVAGPGVRITGDGATGNVIEHNYVGVRATGDAAFATHSAYPGVLADAGASNNELGGLSGNVIAGNAHGVVLEGGTTRENHVFHNNIGRAFAGNGGWGVRVLGAPGSLVEVNNVTDSGAGGVEVAGAGAGESTVWASSITRSEGPGVRVVDAAGVTVGANGIADNDVGIDVVADHATIDANQVRRSAGHGVVVRGSDNFVGRPALGSGPNLVESSGGDGIAVVSGERNRIFGNRLHSNAGLGIDLGDDGVTPSDAGDADSGPNLRQNFPALSAAIRGPDGTTARGVLDSQPSRQYRLEFFATSACDPSGHGEADWHGTPLGLTDVTTDSSGHAEIDTTLPSAPPLGYQVVGTATDSAGNTSELGPCRAVERITPDRTLEVNSPADTDDGCTPADCTLREAINEANAIPSLQRIVFDLPPGNTTIRPASELPDIADALEIDGTTQPGFAGKPIVELDGSNAGSAGLVVRASFSEVRGLVVNRFAGTGIAIPTFRSSETLIAGNFIGTDRSGTGDLGNGGFGVLVYDATVDIGGLDSAERNVISGNDGGGIEVDTYNCCVRIRGNYIGTDASGTQALGNSGPGVRAGSDTTIGGDQPGAGNVISGNTGDGVAAWGGYPSGSAAVIGNIIGLDATGSRALGNAGAGVTFQGDSAGPTRGNVISANAGDGVRSGGSIQGNRIGTDASGREPRGNGGWGIVAVSGGMYAGHGPIGGPETAQANVIGANAAGGVSLHAWGLVQGNFVGTDAGGTRDLGNAGAGVVRDLGQPDCVSDRDDYYNAPLTDLLDNVIAFNDDAGFVERSTCEHRASRILGNAFHGNAALGIDLEGDGVTFNDPLDADPGANLRQNFPVIDAVATSAGGTQVSGRLAGEPDHDHVIELFSNSACDASGHGEGERPLDTFTVHADGAGLATFTHTLPARVPLERPITATATGLDTLDLANIGTTGVAYTSEFSLCAAATADLSVSIGDSPDPVKKGTAVTYTVRVRNDGPSQAEAVNLTVALPKHGGKAATATTKGSCPTSNGAVECRLGDLAAGAEAAVTITVKPTDQGPVRATASISAARPADPDSGDRRAEAVTNVGK